MRRRLEPSERAEHKRELLAACEDFATDHLLRAFSTVGTRGDTDMLLISQSVSLERIHELHVILAQTGLMAWATVMSLPAPTAASALSMSFHASRR